MPTIRSIRRNAHSTEGVLWDFQTGQRVDAPTGNICVLIAERDNPRHREVLARLQLENVEALRNEATRAAAWKRIQTRAMAEAIVLGWFNLDADSGEPLTYSHDEAEKVLSDASLWPFRHFCEDTSGIVRGYVLETEEAAKGN